MSSTKITAVTFNEEMTKHYCLWDPKYPECPERFSYVLKRWCKYYDSQIYIIPITTDRDIISQTDAKNWV